MKKPDTLKLKDRGRGHVWLSIRDGIVVGATGSEPKRYMGLTVAQARHLARYGGSRAADAAREAQEMVAADMGERFRRAERTLRKGAKGEGFARYPEGVLSGYGSRALGGAPARHLANERAKTPAQLSADIERLTGRKV